MAVSSVGSQRNDGIYRTTFDPSSQHPCAAVIEAIETATGGEVETLLADSIDPDTLVQLYRHDSADSWMLNFEHADVEVTLWATGRLHVDTTGIGNPSGTENHTTVPDTPA